MNLNDYQHYASGLCLGSARNLPYLSYGLAAEAGEVLGKLAKAVRDRGIDITLPIGRQCPQVREELGAELGDTLWFVAVLADYLGYTLNELAEMNLEKLESRHARGVVAGSGDSR